LLQPRSARSMTAKPGWTEGRQVVLIAAFSVAFGLVAPWQHVRHDPSHTALEPCVLLIMQRTWATTQFVPFLYLALRLYGRTVLASHAAIAWGLWVHGVEVALAAFSPLDDLVENYRSYYSDVFWLVSLSYFILGAGLVLQPLASRPRAAISALVVALKTLASIAITLRVSEPLQMPPSRVLLSCLGGTAFSHLLGVLAMSTADHTRKQLTLPHSRADELKPSAGPAEQPQPQRIDPLVLQQVLQQVQQPNSSPSWLLGLLYSLLLLAHATPLIIIAMACGLLEAPTISRLFEIETHDANRNEDQLPHEEAPQSWTSLVCLLVAIGTLSVGAVRVLWDNCAGVRLTQAMHLSCASRVQRGGHRVSWG